jgi:alkanesulfonate monooxygenase SsuD/methylene tetrahydromethanopterin reductase-like flavin-dependent oxidoreductase (luciferase family)
MADAMTESHIVGAPDRVRGELVELAERTGADELMVTTMVHGHDHRLRSYELVAEALELDGLPSAPRSVAS